LRLAEPAAEKQKVLGGILPMVPKEICDRYPARRADLIRDFYVQLSDEHSEARSPDRN
jgi:hypothetical protein